MKSEFSCKLEQLIKKQRKTLRYLAEASGLQLDYISKMSKGKRIPQEEEKVKKLLEALECTSGTKYELLQLYRQEKMGKAQWDCMKELIELIQQDISPSIWEKPKESRSYLKLSRETVLNSTEVFMSLRNFFIMNQRKKVYIWTAEIQPQLMVKLLELILEVSQGPIEHLFPLWQNYETEDTLKNLKMIRAVKPVILYREYDPYFYYLQNTGEVQTAPLSNWLIGDDMAMGINGEMSRGIIIKDKNQIKVLKEEFSHKKHMADPLAFRMELSSYVQNVNVMMSAGYVTRNYYIEQSPCLLHLIPASVLKNQLLGTEEEKERLMELIQLRISHMNYEEMVHIFSMEGLRLLMEEGRIAEYPDSLYEPLDQPMRLWLLRRYYQYMRSSTNINCICVRENSIKLPRSISVVSSSNVNNGIAFWNSTPQSLEYVLIKEPGISRKLYQLCQFLEQGGLSYSIEETLTLIHDLILQYGGTL